MLRAQVTPSDGRNRYLHQQAAANQSSESACAGLSALTKTSDDVLSSDATQDATGFSWLCLWSFFFILLALTLATVMSLTSKSRHLVSLMSRGMLFFLAILIAWLGVDCNRITILNRSVRRAAPL